MCGDNKDCGCESGNCHEVNEKDIKKRIDFLFNVHPDVRAVWEKQFKTTSKAVGRKNAIERRMGLNANAD